MDTEAYLRRISYTGSCEPDARTLEALHRSHLLSIPYENFDIHLGRPITLDVERFFQKLILSPRGGFCYEHNGVFAWLLQQFGFDVQFASARVVNVNGEIGRPFAHLVLIVRVDGAEYLADVGFGSLFLSPLRLDREEPNHFVGWSYRAVRDSGEFAIQERTQQTDWRTRYIVDATPRRMEDFTFLCHDQQTSPDSSFVKRKMCTRLTPQGRLTLFDDRLIRSAGDEQSEVRLTGADWHARALREHFGIELPAPVPV
jgi:N-hydroxyarylamine O-acetyltransferase